MALGIIRCAPESIIKTFTETQDDCYVKMDYELMKMLLGIELSANFTTTKLDIINILINDILKDEEFTEDEEMPSLAIVENKRFGISCYGIIRALLYRESQIIEKMRLLPDEKYLIEVKVKLNDFIFGRKSFTSIILSRTFARIAPEALIQIRKQVAEVGAEAKSLEIHPMAVKDPKEKKGEAKAAPVRELRLDELARLKHLSAPVEIKQDLSKLAQDFIGEIDASIAKVYQALITVRDNKAGQKAPAKQAEPNLLPSSFRMML